MLRVIAYALAFVCCKVAFLVLRACGLHVWFGFGVVGLYVCACLLVVRVIVYAFAFVCCQIAFQITRVCILPVCFAFVIFVYLFLSVCLLGVWLCMRLPLFVARLHFMLHMCVDCMCVLLS